MRMMRMINIPEDQLSKLTDEELDQLMESLEKLKIMKEENLIEYTDWDFYAKQGDFRAKVLNAVRTKKGKSIFVVFGGNRSGKSVMGSSIVAELFAKDENLNIWCATEADASIKTQQPLLHEWIPKNSIKEGDFNHSRGWKNGIIEGKTGTRIWFKTYSQDRKSYQGATLDLVHFDEECPYDIYQECLARVMDRAGIVLFTFTSLMGFTRLVNKLYDDKDPKMAKLVERITLSQLDNPYVSDKKKAKYRAGCDPDEIDSRIYGKPMQKEGLIYKEFKDSHILKPFDYIEKWMNDKDRWEIYEGIDPHLRTPHHWARFALDKVNNILFLVDELKAPKEAMVISEFAALIKEKRAYKGKEIKPRYCQIDTSSQMPIPMKGFGENVQEDFTIRTEFAKAGIPTILCQKDNSIGIAAVKKRLMFNKTATQKNIAGLYIFSTCTTTVFELRRYSWASHMSAKVEERKGEMNAIQKKNDHLCDIIKYQCIKLINGTMKNINWKNPADRFRIQ